MNIIKMFIKWVYHIIRNRNNGVKLYWPNNISKTSKFEGKNIIGKRSSFHGEIGYGSYLGQNCDMSAQIGRYCSISDNVVVVKGTHPSSKFVSTHPSFFSTKKQAGFTYVSENLYKENIYADDYKHSCIIGNDVWIGYGVTILEGITIGNGAIIAAGALVTKDVEPYTMVGGVPAKEIRKRFSSEQVQFVSNTKWWDRDNQWIKENSDHFLDINDFITFFSEEYKNENM